MLATREDKEFLKAWQMKRLPTDRRLTFEKSTVFSALTVAVYFYRTPEDESIAFPYTECAILETWRQLGGLKTVIVTNRPSDPVREFAAHWPQFVSVQAEENLHPGTTDDLSIDCLTRLGDRFETDYVLTVQDDGFPVRSGIERFVGKYDFIGAPYRRANLLGLCAGTLRRHWPANGGFSLRSKRLCQMLANSFDRNWYDTLPPGERSEDLYITHVLPLCNRTYARNVRWANSCVAAAFAYDAALPGNIRSNPLGFHNAHAFRELLGCGMIQE